MPKISAQTVIEHRALQRNTLLRVATELLVTGGVEAVTPAAVGAAAGLSRPAVYQYFSSGADILATIIEESFPRANQAIEAALEGIDAPEQRLEIYIRQTLRLASEGVHRPAAALASAQLPSQCRARLDELHHQQISPFLAALAQLQVVDLPITAQLLGGALKAAMTAIESGSPLGAVTERTLALARSAVAGFPLS